MPTTPETEPTTRAAARAARARASGSSKFRGDIEGLRAIAVLLVLIYHAGVGAVSGGFLGVDVFFVVSGFVITNQLLREVMSTGRLSLWGFYGRRAKRLLPAAGLVLVVTAIGAWLAAPRVAWQQIGGDIIGAALYVVNWVFAARSVDYLAEDVDPSPVQHFWSLAVEEQFYLIWPIVILVLVLVLARRARRAAGANELPEPVVPRRRALAWGLLGIIVVPSLVFSVVFTWLRPTEAFFITPTRLWELGIGALVALGAGVFRAWSPRMGALVAWVGLIVLVGSAFVVDGHTPWPGIAAAAPVLGTAAVIAGGFASAGWGPQVVLARRPMIWVGGLSYSLYLWHWPMLRFWEWQVGEFSVLVGLVIVTLSVVPSWLSFKLVESPIRHASSLNLSPRYALSVGFNASLIALVAGLVLTQGAMVGARGGGQATGATWSANEDGTGNGADDTGTGEGTDNAQSTAGPGEDSPDSPAVGLPEPGAEQPGDEPFFDAITPDPLEATADVPGLYEDGCQIKAEDTSSEPCDFGDTTSSTVIAVVGDSKAAQWVPALDTIGKENGLDFRTYTKQGCAFADSMQVDDASQAGYQTCRTWGQDVLERLTGDEKPAAVIVSGVRSDGLAADDAPVDTATTEDLVAGYVRYWQTLEEAGIPVIALSDTPPPGEVGPVYECVDEHRDDPSVCSWPYQMSVGSQALKAAVEQVDGAAYLDIDPWVCPGGTCVGVYRNVMTYRQGSHITATFATVLTEPLEAKLLPMLEAAGVSLP